MLKRTVAILVLGFILSMIAIGFVLAISDAYYALLWLFLWDIFYLILATGILYGAVILTRIKTGSKKIASGELSYKIDTSYMCSDFKELSENLNNINQGLQIALNEKVKSEHFKTELITNVSHDIKTPLTSIINYVDLIQKESIESETVKEYVSVLERQSKKLKKLIEDLIEASKASTGNLPVNLSPCNVGVLLTQLLGEYSEKLGSVKLNPILNIPDKDVIIFADGRHLWRIFDNLLNNIFKYSLESTRVYLDLSASDSKAFITLKNISKFPLNVSGEELTERFIRGDSSRNTEGSGLGLSIAKSLTVLQNGSFDISVDGDLFKVRIEFDLMGEQ